MGWFARLHRSRCGSAERLWNGYPIVGSESAGNVPMILTPDVDGSAPRASRRVSATTGLAAKGPSHDHIEEDGETVFRHACKFGLEGIVSKRKGSPYRSGRSLRLAQDKEPACDAMKREAEEGGDGDRSVIPKS
jgi:hypothetical protein